MKNDLQLDAELPLTGLAAADIARFVAGGQASAVEVLEQHVARIAQVQPKLHAVCVERFEAARAEARAADAKQRMGEPLGPLHGVPITVKECMDLQGTASTFGLASRQGHVADTDEAHVARLRAAGAIPMAKTNVAQALFFYESDNPVYGRTLHPQDANRTPGGSSGGEAALIATGASPLGLGTDIGGSLRVPASFCGIASIKPTAGRCNDWGRYSAPVGQRAIASQVGPMARHVEDVALALEVMNGGTAPNHPGQQPLGDWRGVDLRRLRVAWYDDDGTFAPAPAASRAVSDAARMLAAAGCEVTQWTPPDTATALGLTYGIYFADGGELLRQRMGPGPRMPQIAQVLALARLPAPLLRFLQSALRVAGQPSMARGLAPFGFTRTSHYWELVEAQLDYQHSFERALDLSPGGPFDVILCPPCALPAFTHGASTDLLTAGAYACLYNLLGYPAGVVPFTEVNPGEESARVPGRDRIERVAQRVEQGSAGLPVGVQVVARPWQEHHALAVMGALEALRVQKRSSVGSAARAGLAACASA